MRTTIHRLTRKRVIENSADALSYLPVRDMPANMQVTAKQIRYKGEDNLKNIFAVRRGSSDSGTGQEK